MLEYTISYSVKGIDGLQKDLRS